MTKPTEAQTIAAQVFLVRCLADEINLRNCLDKRDYLLQAIDRLAALSIPSKDLQHPEGVEAVNVDGSPLLEWAVYKWNAEVKNRPLVNVHRRSLDDVWRQVIRWAGGDPVALVGPSHDELLAVEGRI